VNPEVYEQHRGYRRDRWLDGVVAVITWITFLVVGVAIGLVIGYWQWYEATP
jgi:ABC-type xylose transport system permease subunit